MLDRDLLRHIERLPGGRAGYKQLIRELGLGGGQERRELREQLGRLTGTRRLMQVDGDHWAIPKADAGQAGAVQSHPHKAETRRPGIRSEDLVAGRLDLHRDGYGFVRPTPAQPGARPAIEEDVFIPPGEMGGAMQGDDVLVELTPPRFGQRDGRRSGRVLRILTRRNPTVVGIFHYARRLEGETGRGGNFVVPFDERMTQPIVIPFGAELPAAESARTPHRVLGAEAQAARHHADLEGLVVDVEITDWPSPTRGARGRVLEVVGAEDDFGVDVEMVIRKHHLPRVFPDAVLAEARAVARFDSAIAERRRDFRGLPIVTIDGETARDFDDAVLVQRAGDGIWELQVHIADVAEYVRPGTALDLEARLRGTSVYFPDRAIPMLPQELSTDICSLRPNEDRLVLSCLMRIDPQGEILDYEITEGVIRSARRMTYTQVHAVISGDAEARAEFATLAPEFDRMMDLARILNRKRDRRGSIDFDLPEPLIQFDDQGKMIGILRSERNIAHRLIEEFMLVANETVARYLERRGVGSLHRVHEKPDPKKVLEFEELAKTFGYSIGVEDLFERKIVVRHGKTQPPGKRDREGHARMRQMAVSFPASDEIDIRPEHYQRLTEKIAGKPEERILSYLMLRSLRQARYLADPLGHFALAVDEYTHFTSPIRRYPDLIVHRALKWALENPAARPPAAHAAPKSHTKSHSKSNATVEPRPMIGPYHRPELEEIAVESSEAERRADGAERELMEWKTAQYMENHLGDEYDALVISVQKFGLFVELFDVFVEGLVGIDSLEMFTGGKCLYRERDHAIVCEPERRAKVKGRAAQRVFRLGDRVRVRAERIDPFRHRVEFAVIS